MSNECLKNIGLINCLDSTYGLSLDHEKKGCMEKPQHRIEAISNEWLTGLKSCADAASVLGISPERLATLADGGFAPHYRVDDGEPLFKLPELKQWAAANLLQHSVGSPIPPPVKVMVAPPRARYRDVPTALRQIEGLHDITGELGKWSGIYFLVSDGEVIYVGQSVNVSSRVNEHARTKDFEAAFFLPWPGDDLDRVESALIRALKPSLNGQHPSGHARTPTSRFVDGFDETMAATMAEITRAGADTERAA
jgi:hypothetical protein